MNALKVTTSTVKVGEALKWDIIDRHNGILLLKKGAVITSARQRLQLIERGLYIPDDDQASSNRMKSLANAKRGFNPFGIIEACTFRLGRVLFNLTQHKAAIDEIATIVKDLISAFDRDPDAALGAVHLLHGHAYTTTHPIHMAALCYALCQASNIPAEETRTILTACLTSNIGMLELQETLQHQQTPLSDGQKQQIEDHTIESVKILKANGIKDREWLTIVLQHHERANGTGYPNGQTGDDIIRGAKILGLADFYSAIISPRSYKESQDASSALKTLFLERGTEYDETLAVLLIKHMGVFPPGTFVKLKNGETAIVVHRSDNGTTPKVSSLFDPKERPYQRPILRESGEDKFNITGIVENQRGMTFSLETIWGYEPV